jgi:hypothetical protein
MVIIAFSDPDARCVHRQKTWWTGDPVPLTETCGQDALQLLAPVDTIPAPHADDDALPLLHTVLADHAWLPVQHLVEAGSVDAHKCVTTLSIGNGMITGMRMTTPGVRPHTSRSLGTTRQRTIEEAIGSSPSPAR